ncbi:MAG: hypothetical protein IT299_04335 [Dehalococcoidia bacterium]|nr:hypothetical protein [Dehalococcoidia bacterium]
MRSNLEAAKRGDERAFMTLYALRAEEAAVCTSLGLPEHEVKPAIVQAFREAWQTLPRCHATQAVDFDAWLLEILSRCITVRRGDESNPWQAPGDQIWGLPAALRTVMLLREVFGHSLEDIAHAQDEPESTVRLWYRNALEGVSVEI